MNTQKRYKCSIYEHTFDLWEWVRASSPGLAAISYYESFPDVYKVFKTIYVLEEDQNHMVDKPKVFYM